MEFEGQCLEIFFSGVFKRERILNDDSFKSISILYNKQDKITHRTSEEMGATPLAR